MTTIPQPPHSCQDDTNNSYDPMDPMELGDPGELMALIDGDARVTLPNGEALQAWVYRTGGLEALFIPGKLHYSTILQVTHRQYGMGECYEDVPVKKTVTHDNRQYQVKSEIRPTAHFLELLDDVKALIKMRGYRDVAVITHKAVEPFAREILGLTEADTMHFGNLRGRNDFQHKEALFVLGTPSWGGAAVMHAAAALEPNRIEPFFEIGPDGKPQPNWVPMQHEYRLSARGLALWQEVHGAQYNGAARYVNYYKDPMLAAIHFQTREAELLQAVYRARPLSNPADVWIFSPIPLDEEIDGLFDDPPITPGRFSLKSWRKVRDWHDAQPEGSEYGYSELAQGAGVGEKYLKNIKALDTIQEYYGADVERTRENGRGRPTEKIRKKTHTKPKNGA